MAETEKTTPQSEEQDLRLLTDEERAAFEADEGTEIDGSAQLETPAEWASTGWNPPPMTPPDRPEGDQR